MMGNRFFFMEDCSLNFSYHTHGFSQDAKIATFNVDRLHIGVLRLETYAVFFGVEPFNRSLTVRQGHNNISILSDRLGPDQKDIAVHNVRVHHTLSPDLQGKNIMAAPERKKGQINHDLAFPVLRRQHRHACRDFTKDGDCRSWTLAGLKGNAPRFPRLPVNKTVPFERRKVPFHTVRRADTEFRPYFPHTRRDSPRRESRPDKLKDILLAFRYFVFHIFPLVINQIVTPRTFDMTAMTAPLK
jgi:hypothetical protein